MNVEQDLQANVRERFAAVAVAPAGERKFPIGAASAKSLGYDEQQIDSLPPEVTESFAGVGNPLSLIQLRPAQIVVDLGCGAGLDSFLAARRVTPGGKVIGFDMTQEMVDKARRNAQSLGLDNVEFRTAAIETMALETATVDVALSNGVFNLCLDKAKAVAEAFRVLRPGGQLGMADILLEDHVTPEQVEQLGTWSD